MVTKPTGKPVGRPRKPRPPRRARAGRPTLPFRKDPDCYAVALLDAMLALEMGSERACAMGIAALQVGTETGSRRILNGRVVTNWHRKHTRPGSMAATLRGREINAASQAAPHPQCRGTHLAHDDGEHLHARAWCPRSGSRQGRGSRAGAIRW